MTRCLNMCRTTLLRLSHTILIQVKYRSSHPYDEWKTYRMIRFTRHRNILAATLIVSASLFVVYIFGGESSRNAWCVSGFCVAYVLCDGARPERCPQKEMTMQAGRAPVDLGAQNLHGCDKLPCTLTRHLFTSVRGACIKK